MPSESTQLRVNSTFYHLRRLPPYFLAFALLAACIATSAAWAAAPKDIPPPPETRKWLESRQRRFDPITDRTSARDLFHFALTAVDAGWRPESVELAFDVAEQMQDRDPASPTFGNFRWYWHNEKPVDRNAVQFCMEKGVLIRMLHHDALTPKAREQLDRLIRFSIEGIRLHRVSESYTNIFLMKTWNCIAIGEATARPQLAAEGYRMFDRWLMYTWENGIHEYGSPTYYGVDLATLGLIARYAKRPQGRAAAAAVLRLFWTDVAANWFAPAQRLGGAHSRDYDYLTGHGILDHTVGEHGWLDGQVHPPTDIFQRLSSWTPPAALKSDILQRIPRTVVQRWSAEPYAQATHYVGKHFSIGSAGATYGPMDKPLTLSLPGGPKTPVVNFFMDARRDPYGKNKFAMDQSGHSKALHLEPFLTSVQRGPEVLLLAAADPDHPQFKRRAPDPTCLLSQLTFPLSAQIWVGHANAPLPSSNPNLPLPIDQALFLRVEDVAVGIRPVIAIDQDGRRAALELSNDGKQYGAGRLTCIHAATKPKGRGVIALWVRAAEELDDAAFAAFRKSFNNAFVKVEKSGDRFTITAAGLSGGLRLTADAAERRRYAYDGGEPNSADCLLQVDGKDLGREILQDVDPIARYRKLLTRAETGEAGAARPETVIEAEAADIIIPDFQIDRDAKASGQRFLWVPGAEGEGGGSTIARALWLVHIPQAGEYHLWGRLLTRTPDDDSFHLAVRQKERVVLPLSEWHTGVQRVWEWRRATARDAAKSGAPVALKLKAGTATIELRCRENGAKLDAWILTADPNASAAVKIVGQ